MIRTPPSPTRVLVAGAMCLAILGGMLVGHAWPLWTGRTVVLPVRPVDPRDLFRGEFVRLDTPLAAVGIAKAGASSTQADVLPVVGEWPFERAAGRLVYVQLAPREGTPVNAAPEYRAISISTRPVDGAINLRGRVHWSHGNEGTSAAGVERVRIGYGLDAFFMQEGTARPVEDAMRAGRAVQMEVAIASSGRARIRNLLVDGKPLSR
jgi:uncharacterized membrane-anchored protein